MMDTLVTTEWLSAHLDDADLVVLDCSVISEEVDGSFRQVSGRAAYDEAHIPGAGFADLKGELSDQSSAIEFAVPSPEAFCAAMGRLGVGDDSRVVLYDSQMTAWAARVWWMLRWVGFDNAAILDGGLGVWTSEGRPVSSEPVARAQKMLTPKPRPELIVDQNQVLKALENKSADLIDTMPAASFTGEIEPYGRPGHIPGASNVCGLDLLDESGRYKSQADLEAMHPGDRDAATITYCGGGILASSNAFIMTRLGYKDVSVYTASLQEWAADPANPMTVDD